MIYIHVPFCRNKCPYCDFVSFTGRKADENKYAALIIKELMLRAEEIKSLNFKGSPTIYFGGGTPILLDENFFTETIELAKNILNKKTKKIVETTAEANPESCTLNKLRKIKSFGVSRVSLGVQSFNDNELRTLGRTHSADQAVEALCSIKEAGFKNINIDLIYGIPGQTLASWENTLSRIMNFNVQHVSIYPLTISGLSRWNYEDHGYLPDDDLVVDLYETACRILSNYGYSQYEISNFSKQGFKCLHNLNCWLGQDYTGIGIGAHSRIGNLRKWNTSDFDKYISSLNKDKFPVGGSEKIDDDFLSVERLILGLRLNEGIDISGLGIHKNLLHAKFTELIGLGMLEFKKNRLRLTDRSRFISNEVFSELLLEFGR